MNASEALLEIEDLHVSFVQYERGLRRRVVPTLLGMDLSVGTGELVALVGASGSGKSLLAHAVLGMLPPNATESGALRFAGRLVAPAERPALAGARIALLPQSVGYLDPTSPVGAQVRRSARLAGRSRRDAVEALTARGLDPSVTRLYPHQLSGGMARRVLLAMALMGRPDVVIADEPTPGLPEDQARAILAELRALADAGRGVLLITHDLAGALEVADRVVVCREGRTVEALSPEEFESGGDYARRLWRALPAHGFAADPEPVRC